MRPQGKADKCPPPWKGQSIERWQEYSTSLQAWYAANIDFMTQAQSLQKMCQVFQAAGETAIADSLNYYLATFGQDPPPHFDMVLMDIDSLFKVNRVSNVLDIVNQLKFDSSSATEAIAKIDKLSKHKCINWKYFFPLAIIDNIPEGGADSHYQRHVPPR